MPYIVAGKDNYTDFRGRNPKIPECPACSTYLAPYAAPFPGKARPKYDLSSTNEDMDLASPRLRAFLDAACPSPIEWYETGGGYFILRPARKVWLDLSVSGVGYTVDRAGRSGICRTCGRFEARTTDLAATRILRGQDPVGPMDLARTAQSFGTLRQCGPNLIAGDQLVAAMKAEKLKGVLVFPCI